MNNPIFFNRETGMPVQVIAQARTKPVLQDVICYQELETPYAYFVMEKGQFFKEYIRNFEELPLDRQKKLEKHQDLPDKRPRISKGQVENPGQEAPQVIYAEGAVEAQDEMDERTKRLLEFLDAETYKDKLKIFTSMDKEKLDQHMINNIAASLDLSVEDDQDGYRMILSELQIRSKFEVDRGDRL
ncbi:MAG: hypothetical protein K6G62_00195 [Eubacterium sp.]|nr:hypothetical protein [Eubacterium sp.]